jgi:DNA-binding LytR/AlgR family response regulator
MMQICICSENKEFYDQFQNKIVRTCALLDRDCKLEVLSQMHDLLEFDFTKFKILFLDLDCNDGNGIDIVSKVYRKFPRMFLVLLSASAKYAVKGYYVQAYRYILKDEIDNELIPCLEDIWQEIFLREEPITLKGKDKIHKTYLANVVCVEGSPNRTVWMHLLDGRKIECRGKISEYHAMLCDKGFLRIQRSYLANMHYIDRIRAYKVRFIDGKELGVSKSYYSKVQDDYSQWMGEKRADL